MIGCKLDEDALRALSLLNSSPDFCGDWSLGVARPLGAAKGEASFLELSTLPPRPRPRGRLVGNLTWYCLGEELIP